MFLPKNHASSYTQTAHQNVIIVWLTTQGSLRVLNYSFVLPVECRSGNTKEVRALPVITAPEIERIEEIGLLTLRRRRCASVAAGRCAHSRASGLTWAVTRICC